ncbi:MAG: TatD family hydrolase [Candidatus Binataceae bacterium]
MTPLVDTHCHLADSRLDSDLDAVLARAAEAGIAKIVAVGAIGAIENDRRTVAIAETHAHIFAAVGVHPHDAKDCTPQRLTDLRELAASPKVVAIGESGLDFHYMHSPVEAQEQALREHLKLATELNRPIIIHCRDAEAQLAAIVRETGMPPAGAVIHCFTGDTNAAVTFLDLGFFISFSGILTFKNAGALREAARAVPDDRVMVETDAPYLAPEPYRGKRNEPSFVRRTLEVLAEVRGADIDALAERTSSNASRLFGLEDVS